MWSDSAQNCLRVYFSGDTYTLTHQRIAQKGQPRRSSRPPCAVRQGLLHEPVRPLLSSCWTGTILMQSSDCWPCCTLPTEPRLFAVFRTVWAGRSGRCIKKRVFFRRPIQKGIQDNNAKSRVEHVGTRFAFSLIQGNQEGRKRLLHMGFDRGDQQLALSRLWT